MWQFGTSAINTVVHWHKCGNVENGYVENECTPYNFGQFAIFVPKIVGFGGSLSSLKFLVQITSTKYLDYSVSFTLNNITLFTLLLLS